MATDPRLERYPATLERVLRPLPVGDRADIIAEIKSHVQSALERDPAQSLDTVLAAIGEPETVANRYLLERNLQPAKPPISPAVKWIVIGFLGTVAMFFLFVGSLIWRFTPLLRVDDPNERVTILGGLIDVDGKKGTVHVGRHQLEGRFGPTREFSGTKGVPAGMMPKIQVKFGSGRVHLDSTSQDSFEWDCRAESGEKSPELKETGDSWSLDLSGLTGVSCDLTLPEDSKLALKGVNGKVEVDELRSDLDLELANGKVLLEPDSDKHYHYGLSVTHGAVDEFKSSDDAKAIHVAVRLGNGKITRND